MSLEIGQISSSNTFLNWVIKTQELTVRVPEFVDYVQNTTPTLFANTNISVEHDVTVSGNVNVAGLFVLTEDTYDDLNVAGNLTVTGTVTTTNTLFSNLTIDGTFDLVDSISIANLQTQNATVENLEVLNFDSYDLEVTNTFDISTATLTVSNVEVSENVTNINTSSLFVGGDFVDYGTLNVDSYFISENLNLNNVDATTIVSPDVYVTNDFSVPNDLTSVQNVLVTNGTVTISNEINSLNVTNSGTSAYLFDLIGGNNPTIEVYAGQTIAFYLNVTGHPFLIRESPGGANTSEGLTHVSPLGVVSTGLDAQGQVDGILYWQIPHALASSTYVYQCFFHPGAMVGNISIGQPYPQANSVTANSVIVSANIKTANITNELKVGTDANIYGNLTVAGDTYFDELNFTGGGHLNIETANIISLIGEENENIYNTINSTTAFVSVQANVGTFIGLSLALG